MRFVARDVRQVTQPNSGDLEEMELVLRPFAVVVEDLRAGRLAAHNRAMPLNVATDLTDIERTPKGSIVARVWFVLDDHVFPERRWSDLIVVVLGWWIEELLRAQSTDETSMTLLFMDGPYSVRMREPSEGDAWSVSFLRDRGPADARRAAVGSADLEEFGRSLLTAAREVVVTCRARGWADDPEVVKLGRLVDSLASHASEQEVDR
jgi:hypothetical protein